jgi:hypothetical protein
MRRALFAALAVLVCLVLLPASGCLTLPTAASFMGDDSASRVCRVVCMWDRNVRIGQDTQHDGASITGLAGTVYFFGVDDGPSLVPHGKFVAEWYDLNAPIDANTKPLHTQVYEADALSAMKRKSPVGPAYTLFLDWPNYRPDITRVLIKTRFYPANGRAPVFADPAQISLHTDVPMTRQETTEHITLAPGGTSPKGRQ